MFVIRHNFSSETCQSAASRLQALCAKQAPHKLLIREEEEETIKRTMQVMVFFCKHHVDLWDNNKSNNILVMSNNHAFSQERPDIGRSLFAWCYTMESG